MDLQLQMPFIYPFMCGFIFNDQDEGLWQAEVKWQAALVSSIWISEVLQKAFSCIRLFSITLDFMVFIGIGFCLEMVHILKALFAS